ncbi:sporulation delaying protein family toxin [Bacillus pseudomycoides]|uniref:sporulation delaying protein family toxin n=1 Tax=Bacillus pseudomycoides TaxID=64104 RepID=UPI0014825664|nr:sporulation delaying protein family toxin [Bacillus pseudomycoides]
MKLKKVIPTVLALALAINSTPVFAADNSISNAQNKPTITTESKHQQYDGETIYRGVFFGEGPVAKLFPEIWSEEATKQANTAEGKKAAELLAKKINELDPNYFNELQAAVSSGDNIKIQEAFNKGGELLVQVGEVIQNKKVGEGQGLLAGVVVAVYAGGAVTTVVVITHAAAVTAAVAVAAWKWKYGSPADPSDSDTRLKHEMFIDKVATTFAK